MLETRCCGCRIFLLSPLSIFSSMIRGFVMIKRRTRMIFSSLLSFSSFANSSFPPLQFSLSRMSSVSTTTISNRKKIRVYRNNFLSVVSGGFLKRVRRNKICIAVLKAWHCSLSLQSFNSAHPIVLVFPVTFSAVHPALNASLLCSLHFSFSLFFFGLHGLSLLYHTSFEKKR